MVAAAQYKKDIVKKINDAIKEYPIIGVVNMENLPAKQLQIMREKLRDKVQIFMAKKRLMRIAFDASKSNKEGIEKLSEHFRGMPALVFTKDNPFSLFKVLKQNKSSAPAKAGQQAPNDIVVKAGATPFAPGPIIGELGALGIKTGVEGGKIAIKDDCVVCKEGEEISSKLAGILTRLDIQPMEVGLDLIAIYEDETIFTKSVLDIDEEAFMKGFMQAASDAFSLSIEISYVSKDNIEALLSKGQRESVALSTEAVVMTEDTRDMILSRAQAQMTALKNLTG